MRADGTKSEGYVTVYRETLPFLVDQIGFEKDWQKKFWAWRDVAYPNAKERPYWYKQAEEFLKEWGEHVRCERERGDEFLSRITDVLLFCGNNGRMLSAACGAANADRRAA